MSWIDRSTAKAFLYDNHGELIAVVPVDNDRPPASIRTRTTTYDRAGSECRMDDSGVTFVGFDYLERRRARAVSSEDVHRALRVEHDDARAIREALATVIRLCDEAGTPLAEVPHLLADVDARGALLWGDCWWESEDVHREAAE